MDFAKIKNEILNAVKDKSLLDKVKEEVDFLNSQDGLKHNTALMDLYSIWKENQNNVGTENKSNSWIAYAIGMTNKKPETNKIISRRYFVRPGPPDVDTDFEDDARGSVIKHMQDKYGHDKVAPIGTYQDMKAKKTLRYVIKALDMANSFHKGKDDYVTDNEKFCKDLISTLPSSPGSVIKHVDEDGSVKMISSVRDMYKYIPEFKSYIDRYPDIMQYSSEIEGLSSSFGVHAGGVILSDVPLSEISAVRRAKEGEYATQYTMEDVEEIGLIKFDILAVSTLNIIHKTMRLVKENYDIDINIKDLPLDDKKTLELYRTGNLAGVFQCEGYQMRETMKAVKVDRFEDVSAVIALYRPGPMDSIPEYCDRKHGRKPIDYFHPSVEPFVKPHISDTYGILIYQEQLMKICNSLANFSITDGYMMIKAVGKKKSELLSKYRKQFIEGCIFNKVPQDVAEQYWDKFITPFASYGFNKCLSGDTCVKDKLTGNLYTLEQLEKDKEKNIVLDSYKNGKIIDDKIEEVFCTGEKDIYEIELDNGAIIRCTLDHKFICDDGEKYSVKEIMSSVFAENAKKLHVLCAKENIERHIISSGKYVGKEKTYNVTMQSQQHNYAIYDKKSNQSIFTANSHSIAYAFLSWQSAYLKANYPDEFICSVLNQCVEKTRYDKIEDYERDFSGRMGIQFLPRTINNCGLEYKIERKKNPSMGIPRTEIRPSIFTKNVGHAAAEDLVSNAPYKNIQELAMKSGKAVTTEVVRGLIDGGFFKGKKGIQQKDKLIETFSKIRKDKQKAQKKGVDATVDIFG